MKEEASKAGMAKETRTCPRCQGKSFLIRPSGINDVVSADGVYFCQACKFTFHGSGKAFVDGSAGFGDIFRAVTEGQKVLRSTVPPSTHTATQTVLLTQILEYGTKMYFDGLKQGLLIALQWKDERDGKTGD